jgi:uncharacterized protein
MTPANPSTTDPEPLARASGSFDPPPRGRGRGWVQSLTHLPSRALSTLAIALIRLYQFTLSPLMGGHCRFHPTCSVYAIDAYSTHNPFRASWLTLRRLARCHPLGGHGIDPVPPPRNHAPPKA